MYRFIILYCIIIIPLISRAVQIDTNDIEQKSSESKSSEEFQEVQIRPEDTPCTCGVFLSSQFIKGSKSQPKGGPVLTQEIDTPFMNNAFGNKQCTHRCLDMIVKHLPKSNEIICATVEKDRVYREKAFLFVKNRSEKWHPTNFSAGREFCCKDHESLKCSQMS